MIDVTNGRDYTHQKRKYVDRRTEVAPTETTYGLEHGHSG